MDIYYRTDLKDIIYTIRKDGCSWISYETYHTHLEGSYIFPFSFFEKDKRYNKLSKGIFLSNYLKGIVKRNHFSEQRKTILNDILKGLL